MRTLGPRHIAGFIVIIFALAAGCERQQATEEKKETPTFRQLAYAQVEAPDLKELLDKARHAAEKIDDRKVANLWGAERDVVLLAITAVRARLAAKKGDVNLMTVAEAAAQPWNQQSNKLLAMCQVAWAQAQLGQKDLAKRTFARALTMAQDSEHFEREDFFEKAAVVQAEAGVASNDPTFIADAIETAMRIRHEFGRGDAIGKIARTQAEAGARTGDKSYFAQAIETGKIDKKKLPGKNEDVWPAIVAERILLTVVAAQVEAASSIGNAEYLIDARKTAELLQHGQSKPIALARIALGHVKTKNMPNAREIFNEATQLALADGGFFRDPDLQTIARHLGTAVTENEEFFAEAQRVAEQIRSKDKAARVGFWNNIARSQARLAARTGDARLFTEARASAEKGRPAGEFDQTMEYIAAAQAEAAVKTGDAKFLNDALQTTDSIKQSAKSALVFYHRAYFAIAASQVRMAAKTDDASFVSQACLTAGRLGNERHARAWRRVAAVLAENDKYPTPIELTAGGPMVVAQIYVGLAEGIMRKKNWWSPIPGDEVDSFPD